MEKSGIPNFRQPPNPCAFLTSKQFQLPRKRGGFYIKRCHRLVCMHIQGKMASKLLRPFWGFCPKIRFTKVDRGKLGELLFMFSLAKDQIDTTSGLF